MTSFHKYNTLCGWLVFAITLVVYSVTMEPTASFWDCSEFIAASYKLQVPHPPGAPLFLLIGRMFSFLSFGDSEQVAYWINMASVLAGAFTAVFLFWSIVMLGRKIVSEPNVDSPFRSTLLLGAGAIGSLSYAFTDSAWFSAVEAEVYSMSAFFTAFVVWAMLKWETIADESQANRWLIFIFYVIGLSIGVHLLNLVTIPALAFIYYFKKYRPRFWGIVGTAITSLLIVFVINKVIIPGLPDMAGSFEIIAVNGLGLPFGAGAAFFGALVVGGLVTGIMYTQRKQKVLLNTVLLATAFVLIGYASYTLVIVRSNFNTPINENDPSDAIAFVKYLKREQYGTWPILYGTYFTAKPVAYEQGDLIYRKGADRYEEADRKVSVRYAERDQTILPRVWSTDPRHEQAYRDVLGLRKDERPTFSDNIRFLITHQVGWMYVRYFMFNFAGRESDNQNAAWLNPTGWFEDLPLSLSENRGRNNFFMIPFLLGLVGMYFQLIRNSHDFVVVLLLFLLTGVALVIYLNSPPVEPRERDYIYVGSYYAYCIWIGFAVIALGEWLRKLTGQQKASAVLACMLGLSSPILLANDGWDDHDRSNRYFSVDTAVNDLQSCAPDSILFTGGDNDTFPQWYVQDVENVRTDVRVIVTSYFNTEWYVAQTMRPVYTSQPFPYTLTRHHYREGGPNNPYLPYYEANIRSMDLHQYLALLKKDHPGLRMYPTANVIPSRDIVLKVDVEKVKAMGIVPPKLEKHIVPEMHLKLTEGGLELKDLALLDILATSGWTRPVYATSTAMTQFNIDLNPYAVREGNVYRILPVMNPHPDYDLVNTHAGYKAVTEKFRFRGLDDPSIYFTDDYRRAVQNHRNSMNELATALVEEGDTAKAREVVMLSLNRMPDKGVRYDATHLRTLHLLFILDERDRALEIGDTLGSRAVELADYYRRTGDDGSNYQLQIAIIHQLSRIWLAFGERERASKLDDVLSLHMGRAPKRRDM